MRAEEVREAFPDERVSVLLQIVEDLARIKTFEDWTVVSSLRERARKALA